MPCQQMCPRPCLKYPFCHLSMFTNCVSFSFCVGNWVWFIQSHCFVEAQYLTFGLVCHLQQNMSTVSSTCATFRSPLRLSFPSEQVNGKTSSNLKMVTLGWTKTCFPTLNNNRSRFRVSCSAKPETVQKVCDIVRKQLALSDETQLTPESKFTSLGADSLDTVEIVMNLEEEFDISVEEENSENITTVQEAANLIDKLVQNKAQA